MRHVNDLEQDTKQLCLLIHDDDIADTDASQRWLGDTMHVETTRWQGDEYLEIIHRLRPAVIVTEAATIEWASDYAMLVATLISYYRPTVVGFVPPRRENDSSVYLIARQIGEGAGIRLASLADIDFGES